EPGRRRRQSGARAVNAISVMKIKTATVALVARAALTTRAAMTARAALVAKAALAARAAPIAVLAALCTSHAHAGNPQAGGPVLSFSGFGTLGVVHSSEDQADFTSTLFKPD